MEMLTISAEAIDAAVDMRRAIDVVDEALQAAHAGLFLMPQRAVMGDGRAMAMVAGRTDDPGVVWKVLTIVPDNPARSLPTIHSVVMWADDETGVPVALLDGEAVTNLRTAAVSGVATRRLADERAHCLAMLGAGAQARGQVHAVATVRPIEQVRVWSRTAEHARALVTRLSQELPHIDHVAVETPADAVRQADVICAATRATSALIRRADLASRVHVNAIGAYQPSMIEVEPAVFDDAVATVADDVAAVLVEGGDIVQAIAAGTLDPDTIQALGGLPQSGHHGAPQTGITVFKSVGTAALDWAVAEAVFRTR